MQVTVDRAQALDADDATSLQAVHVALSAAGERVRSRSVAELWSSSAMGKARAALATSGETTERAAA
jgi:hypothetical protein